MKIVWKAAALVLAVAISSPSLACRVSLSPKDRLASGYNRGTISAVVLVQIAEADYSAPPSFDAHPWIATGSVAGIYRGEYTRPTVRFERGHGSAACDDGHPPPKAGERWIVYFWKRGEGDQQVWQSYPAETALKADPNLLPVAR